MNSILSVHWVLAAAIWYLGNGLLHDIFVLSRHKTGYDRDLLRLLLDGHILMLSGAITLVAYLMLLQKLAWGAYIGVIIGISVLIYCALIFPFLKSVATMIISLILIIVSVKAINDSAVL